MGSRITGVAQQYIELYDEIKAKKAEIKALEEKADAVNKRLLDLFTEDSVEKLTVSDASGQGRTLFVYTSMWAKLKDGLDKDIGLAALRKAKLTGLISENWNASQFSSWVREQQREGKEIPKAIADAFNFNPTYEVRVNKA